MVRISEIFEYYSNNYQTVHTELLAALYNSKPYNLLCIDVYYGCPHQFPWNWFWKYDFGCGSNVTWTKHILNPNIYK
jgi:hypothetical protein